MRPGDPTFDLPNVVCKHATPKAILIETDEGEEIWVPQNQISEDSEVYDVGHRGTLIMSEWIAKQKNLI